MPRLIDPGPCDPLDLAGFVATVEMAAACAPLHGAALTDLAPALAGLGANRDFLGDFVLRELEQRCVDQVRGNRYTAQVIMLHQGDGWFARACLWPAADDAAVRASGIAPFFYGVPHDHNFDFLTTGYLGPGYWSDYYERDPDAPDPVAGDVAGLRAMGRRRLGQGEVMLYREGRDVHCQWPADSFSVSINILPLGPGRRARSQYRYDVAADRVGARLTRTALETLLPLAAHLGGADGMALVEELGATHGDDHVRFAAIAALSGAQVRPGARRRLLEQAAGAGDGGVARLAEARLAMLTLAEQWSSETDAPAGARPPTRG